MFDRLVLSLALIALGLIAYALVNRRLLRPRSAAPGLEGLPDGQAAILLFGAPDCRPCHLVQKPAIRALIRDLDLDLRLIEVDVYERQDLADYWGVLSLPTTFIIDSQRRPRRVNHGVADRGKLMRQLQAIGVIAEHAGLAGEPVSVAADRVAETSHGPRPGA